METTDTATYHGPWCDEPQGPWCENCYPNEVADTDYLMTDPYWMLVDMDEYDLELSTTTGWPDEYENVAKMLHHYTGLPAALMTDGGAVLTMHLQGSTNYSLLIDDMGGSPTMWVLYEDGIAQRVWRVLFQQAFCSWEELAQAAAAIKLR